MGTTKRDNKRRVGRPDKGEEKVNHDGVFSRQWKRILKEAKIAKMDPHVYHRWILDDYFGRLDAERASETEVAPEEDLAHEDLIRSHNKE